MTNGEAVNWIINISADIGKVEHRDLWHYEQALSEIRDMLETVQPEIVRCKDCKHRPVTNDNYDDEEWDCGFNIEFPDYKCPCRCDDGWYNRLPDDNWFCGNAERKTNEHID